MVLVLHCHDARSLSRRTTLERPGRKQHMRFHCVAERPGPNADTANKYGNWISPVVGDPGQLPVVVYWTLLVSVSLRLDCSVPRRPAFRLQRVEELAVPRGKYGSGEMRSLTRSFNASEGIRIGHRCQDKRSVSRNPIGCPIRRSGGSATNPGAEFMCSHIYDASVGSQRINFGSVGVGCWARTVSIFVCLPFCLFQTSMLRCSSQSEMK